MIVYAARDADTAGICQPVQARGDIYTVAENIAVLQHDVADIDSDAKLHSAIFFEVVIRVSKLILDFDCTLDHRQGAAERGRMLSPAVPQILPSCREMSRSVTRRKADKVANVPSSSISIKRL